MSRRIVHGSREYLSVSEAMRELDVCYSTIMKRLRKARNGEAAYLFGLPIYESMGPFPVDDPLAQSTAKRPAPSVSKRRPGPLLIGHCTHRLGAWYS